MKRFITNLRYDLVIFLLVVGTNERRRKNESVNEMLHRLLSKILKG